MIPMSRSRSRRTRGVSIDGSAGLVSASRGVDVGEPPLELADIGARALDVEQVAGLADAVQEAVVAQLPAMSLDRSWLAPGIYGRIWQFGLAAAKAKRGRMLTLSSSWRARC